MNWPSRIWKANFGRMRHCWLSKKNWTESSGALLLRGIGVLLRLSIFNALMMVKMFPRNGVQSSRDVDVPKKLFTKIPYILADSRQDIESFLGFRHVTGIKQWQPAQKAQYIAKLIDERGMNYEEVMRKIG